MCGYAYHDLRPDRNTYTSEQVSAFLSRCRRRVEWRRVVIPEAEHCEHVDLCDTDRRALGDVMAMY